MSTGVSAPRERLSAQQIVALLAIACLNMQDGFDILSISFSAGSIAEDWGLEATQLGVVFSASLFGMMLGAMFLAPFADKIGRKLMAVIGLAVSGVGMVLAAIAPSVDMLVAARLITGLGIGSILACLNTLAAEYAGDRFRSMAVSTFQLGYPLGAFFAGYLVAWLLQIGDWRSVFWLGAGLSFLFIPIMLVLPESTEFLARSGRADALERINRIRARFRREPLNALPAHDAPSLGVITGVATLFAPRYALRTALIWLAFFLLLTSLYFLLSWTPRVVESMGLGVDVGNRAGRLLNIAGIPGTILMGLLATFSRPAIAATLYLASLVLVLLMISIAPIEPGAIVMWFIVAGFFAHGSMISLYTVVPTLYPTELRATGTGWSIGLSRFGAVVGPALAGYFINAGVPLSSLYQLFALPVALAAACAFGLWMLTRAPR